MSESVIDGTGVVVVRKSLLDLGDAATTLIASKKKGKNCIEVAIEVATVVDELVPNFDQLDDYDVDTGFIFTIDVLGDPSVYTAMHVSNFIIARARTSTHRFGLEVDGYDPAIAARTVLDEISPHPIMEIARNNPANGVVYASGIDTPTFGFTDTLRQIPKHVSFERHLSRQVFLGSNVGNIAAHEYLNATTGLNPDKSALPILLLGNSRG